MTDANPASRPLRPITSEEIAAFRRDGAVVLRQILPLEWVRRVGAALDALDADPPALAQRTESDGARSLVVQLAASVSDELRRYAFESPAAEIAATLHGSAQLHYYLDQVFCKQPGRVGETDWHQDTAYLNVEGHDLIRVWTPCDPVPRELAIEVVRGSHRWNVTYRTNIPEAARQPAAQAGGYSYGNLDADLSLPPVPDIAGQRDSFDILGWAVEPGDVVVFHGHILHGAGGLPHHPLPRRAFAVLYAGDDERFLWRGDGSVPDNASLNGIRLLTGERLRDRPDAFPQVWPRPANPDTSRS
jgi:ectoine hydroxylase-related dioxygenase (phytanoyl-CoA dioxygenase family)